MLGIVGLITTAVWVNKRKAPLQITSSLLSAMASPHRCSAARDPMLTHSVCCTVTIISSQLINILGAHHRADIM